MTEERKKQLKDILELESKLIQMRKDYRESFIHNREEKSNRDVHTEHCCIFHGCKYGYEDCPVESGVKAQSYPCEECDWEEEDFNAQEKFKEVKKLEENVSQMLNMSCVKESNEKGLT